MSDVFTPPPLRETPVLSAGKAWSEIMRRLPAVGKHERNKAPGANYDYRGIDTIVNAYGPLAREFGVTMIPRCVSFEFGELRVGKDQRTMGHARLIMEYTILGPAGDTLPVGGAAGEAFDSGDKATPKASSVAWRTFLIQALALPTDEPDPDSFHYERAQDETPTTQLDPEEELYRLKAEGFELATKVDQAYPAKAMIEALGKPLDAADLDDWRTGVAALRVKVGGLA